MVFFKNQIQTPLRFLRIIGIRRRNMPKFQIILGYTLLREGVKNLFTKSVRTGN